MARSKKDIEADDKGPKDIEEFVLIGGVEDIPADRPDDVALGNTIETARNLLEQKKDILSKIQEARELSTMLVNMGSGSRDQAAWVRFYLPRKKRKVGEVEDEVNGGDEE